MLDQPTRRDFVKGFLGGIPLAAVLASPVLAQAAARELPRVTIKTAGGMEVSGALAMPAKLPAPAVLCVHEWWGLVDNVKVMAGEFASHGYIALACDLYKGNSANTRDGARALMKSVDPKEATETVAAWADWLKAHQQGTGKIGTVGWCFGGGWSLNTGIATPVDATVVYYGRVNKKAAELSSLKGPVLGHYASRDKWINKKMVSAFEAEMDKAGKKYISYWYEAEHAFANPTGARYDKEDAKLAWKRTLAFYAGHLG